MIHYIPTCRCDEQNIPIWVIGEGLRAHTHCCPKCIFTVQVVCISDDLRCQKLISSSSACNQLRSVLLFGVGEAAQTVILELPNSIKVFSGAGGGCCQDQALSRCSLGPEDPWVPQGNMGAALELSADQHS